MSTREPGRPPFLQGPTRIPTSHDADHTRVLIALACLMELVVTAAKARKQTAKALERANRSVCIRPDGHLLGAPLCYGTRTTHGVAGDEEAPDARTEEVGNRLQPAYEESYGG